MIPTEMWNLKPKNKQNTNNNNKKKQQTQILETVQWWLPGGLEEQGDVGQSV